MNITTIQLSTAVESIMLHTDIALDDSVAYVKVSAPEMGTIFEFAGMLANVLAEADFRRPSLPSEDVAPNTVLDTVQDHLANLVDGVQISYGATNYTAHFRGLTVQPITRAPGDAVTTAEAYRVDRESPELQSVASAAVLDLSSWTRLAEVKGYATAHGVTLDQAIKNLVNQGLSHERRTYL